MNWQRLLKPLMLAAVFVVILIIPLITQDIYVLGVLIQIILSCFLAFSLYPTLRTGLMNVGLGGFMAVGGYTAALLVARLGFNSWYALLLAGFMATLVALPIGFISLRMRGFIFAIFTLALNQIVTETATNWTSLTGGPIGVPVSGPNPIRFPGLTTVQFTSKVEFYYLIVALTAICLLIAYRITHSHIGKLARSIDQNEDLARSLGVKVFKYKMIVFLFGCFFAGIAGAYVAQYRSVISPGQFGIWKSFYVLIYIQAGGLGSLAGAATGAVILTALPEAFRFLQAYEPLILGGVLIVGLRFFPQGFISLPPLVLDFVKRSWFRVKSRKAPATEDSYLGEADP